MRKLKIRDFIYMDIDRLKSIVSQLEAGFTEMTQFTRDRSTETQVEAEAGLLGFLKARGQQTFAWQSQQTETKSLHDHVYDLLEEDLKKNSTLVSIPGDITEDNFQDETARAQLDFTSFLLIDGFALINDFTRMMDFLNNFEDLTKFLTSLGMQSLPANLASQQRKEAKNRLRADLSLDHNLVNGIQLIFSLFYKGRIVLKLIPFQGHPNFRLVCTLDPRFLRETIDGIIFKYGTNPTQRWRMLAQVADIPSSAPAKMREDFLGASIEVGLQKVFESFRGLEALAQTVAYPEISVTPIALYRD